MHILILSQYFWPESFRINDLALALKEQGHEVTVLTGMPSYPQRGLFKGYTSFSPKTENYQGISVLRVPLLSRGKGSSWRLLLNYLSFVISASLLAPWRCRNAYDVIFVFQPSPITSVLPGLLLRRIKRIPLLLWVQDLWPETLRATGVVRNEQWLGYIGHLVKFIYKRCDKILVPAKNAEAAVKSMDVPAEKIHYFPNWAESVYQPKAPDLVLKQNLPVPTGFWIMFAGNLGVSQSLETLLSAAQQLKSYTDIHIVVIGDGRQFAWMQEQIGLLGLSNVHLLGRKPVKQMPDFFALADALLISLKNDPIFAMTIPSKLQSYLACGRPIIGAIDGEGAEIIKESATGFVGPAEDADALANHILAMYHTPLEQRQVMGERGISYYKRHFGREKLVTHLQNWMEQLVE